MGAADVFGRDFAPLYGCLLAVATVAALVLRSGLQGPGDGPDTPDAFSPALHPIEIAYLAGGVPAAMESAVASVRRQALVRDAGPTDRRTSLDEVLRNDVLPMERAIYTIVAAHGGAVEQARREADPVLAPVRSRLTWLKLVAPEPSMRRVRRLHLLLFGTLLALGGPQIARASIVIAQLLFLEDGIPTARGTPPDYVVLMLWGTAAWLLMYLRPTPPYRTRRGQRLLDHLRATHIALLWTLRHRSHRLPANDYVLAVALFGEEERAAGEAYAAIVRVATRRTPPGVADDYTRDGGSKPWPLN